MVMGVQIEILKKVASGKMIKGGGGANRNPIKMQV